MQDPFRDPLDALFAEAMEAERKHPTRPVMKPGKLEPAKVIHSNELYTLPENWEKQPGGIALIHQETNTLLGNYTEYRHKKVKNTRRLVREDNPITVSRTELVFGPQWIFVEKEIPAPTVAVTKREVILDLSLAELGVHADNCPLIACLAYGGITRAELRDHTTFHSPDNRTILTLSAGVNIYPCMDLAMKVLLRKELSV